MEHIPHQFVVDSGMFDGGDDSSPFSFLSAMIANNKGDPNPGDDDYPQYNLPYFVASERMMTYNSQKGNRDVYRAFTIANKATTALENDDVKTARKMGYHALSLDMSCVDAWRTLCNCLNSFCDGDTVVCAEREVLNFARRFQVVQETLAGRDGCFYNVATTRPYIRLLLDLGSAATQSEQIDVAINVYEEVLRLNHNDNTGSRDYLLGLYMKIIGRLRKYPDTKPVRTIKQADALINLNWDDNEDGGIFEDDNIIVRWYKMLKAYAERRDWKSLAKKEKSKNDIMFKVVFGEKDIKSVQRVGMPGQYPFNPPEEVLQKGHIIQDALYDWPDFVIDCYKVLKGEPTKKFREHVQGSTPNPTMELTQPYKESMRGVGQSYLEHGRKSLRDKQFQKAVENCTLAKRGFYEAALPSRRFYHHSPFAVVSNRATGAMFIEEWNLVRIDTRYTLEMKPDHKKSYERLTIIAEKFKAKQLIPEFKEIEETALKGKNSPEDWKKLARRAIGLISIPALVLASQNKLTEGDKEEFIKIGIEDMYTPVNFPAKDMRILPFLKESDLEKEIKNI